MNIELLGFITYVVPSSLYLGLRKGKDPILLVPPSIHLLCFFSIYSVRRRIPFYEEGRRERNPSSKGLFVLIINFPLLFQAEFE